MDFAADAVFDVIAPPTRSANARAAAKADTGRSFDDHLQEAAPDEPPSPPEQSSEPSTNETSAPVEAKDAGEKVVFSEGGEAQDSANAPAPAFVVQIVTPPPAAAVTTPIVEAETQSLAAAPLEAEEPADAPAAPVAAPQAPPSANAGVEKPDAAKSNTEDAKTAPALNAPPADAASAQNNAAPIVATPSTSAPVPTETPMPPPPPEITAAAAAPAPPVTREASQSTRKATAPSADAPEAPADAKAARADVPQAKANKNPHTAPVSAAARDAGAPMPNVALETSASTQSQSATPLMQQSASTHHSASVDHSNVARAAPAVAQVAREIVRRFTGGTTQFDLRLDPPELGRVDVRLEVSRDHRVTAVVSADNPQALAELARHARDLESMLQSSGLELSDNGLSFDLRQGSEGDSSRDDDAGASGARDASGETEQALAPSARPLGFERWRGVRVDLMV